jgi:hypothetical protein
MDPASRRGEVAGKGSFFRHAEAAEAGVHFFLVPQAHREKARLPLSLEPAATGEIGLAVTPELRPIDEPRDDGFFQAFEVGGYFFEIR